MLLGLRKIVLHGLRKQCGDRWPTDGCPSQVYERLLQRKETEQAIERLSLEDEDLMSFATFADLAETIQANERLAALLHNLAPSADVLCARLIDLETMRGKLARGILLNPEELSLLSTYSGHLRETLAGARRKKGRGGKTAPRTETEPEADAQRADGRRRPGTETSPAVVETAADPASDAADATRAQPQEAVPSPKKPEPKPAPACQVQPPADMVTDTTRDPASAPSGEAADASAPAAKQRPAEKGAAPSPLDPDVLAEDVQKAMVDDDDAEVLRLLRREIIAAAEAMYRSEPEIAVRGWQEVVRDGWLKRRRDDLALGPLEEFHRLLEEYEERRRSADGSGDVVRTFLGERQFPKLLLSLRETFRANGL